MNTLILVVVVVVVVELKNVKCLKKMLSLNVIFNTKLLLALKRTQKG